jgi:hypothetical protein
MKRDRRNLIRIPVHLVVLAIFIAPFVAAQSTPNPPSGQSTGSSPSAPADASTKNGHKASSAKSAPSAKITQTQIDAAKASGQVWVNTDTGVYHKGGRWYGKTKQGKFMDEKDAKKAGYKEAEKE